MAQRIIVYWRDIPTQITVKAGRKTARRELPEYFIKAVDAAAMKVGAKDSDAYLAEWRRGDPEPCGDDLEAEADAALEDMVNRFDKARLKALIMNMGYEPQESGDE
ncbi:MAG: virulence factor [Pseudomonadota bacterium]